jgi:peptidyl-prolyl cis-trans isomerase C
MADVLVEVDLMLGGSTSKPPPDKSDKMRQAAVKTVVERFVANTLLLGEADRVGITLTPDDETNAVAALQAMLPPGVTAEQAMRQSPVGEARFREEMLAAARIKKMLRTASIPETNITDTDYKAFTNQFKAEIDRSEAVRARHILFAIKPTDDTAEKSRKRELADSVRTQLLAGADFAEMAKTHSDCPSKNMGGDLGRFGRRKMVKPFSDAAFSQSVNAIGEVVETQFGYHIIQVTERKAIGKDELLDILRRRRLLERLTKAADIRLNQSLGPQGDRKEAATTQP